MSIFYTPIPRQFLLFTFFLVLGMIATTQGAARPPQLPVGSTSSNSTSYREYGKWRSSIIGGGGYIQNVVVAPSNPTRLYAYVDVGGIFRSDDGGKTWRMLHHRLLPPRFGTSEVRGLVVDPQRDRSIVVAVGSQWSSTWPGGIFVSEDGGENFQCVKTLPFAGNGPYRYTGFILVQDPQNPKRIYAGTAGGGLWCSQDQGKNWQNLGLEGYYFTHIMVDSKNSQRIWACSLPFSGWIHGKNQTLKGGFFVSEDGGSSWKTLSEDLPLSELIQDPQSPNTLYGIMRERIVRSLDGGQTWDDFSKGLPPLTSSKGPAKDRFNALAIGPDFLVTASSKGDFYRLPLQGSTWEKISREKVTFICESEPWLHPSSHFGDALGSITIHPHNPNHWFFTDWYAIYQTQDGGKTWTLTIDGIEVTVIHCIQQDPQDEGFVHMGMADLGYFYSSTGGNRFYTCNQGISNNIKCISLSPKLPARIYAVGPQTWEWEANQVFVSIDRGQNWIRAPMIGLPDMSKHHCNTIVVSPEEPYTLYLAVSQKIAPNEGGVYKSINGGKSWEWIGQGLENQGEFHHDIWTIGREIAVNGKGEVMCILHSSSKVFRWNKVTFRWEEQKGGWRKPNEIIANPLGTQFWLACRNTGIWTTEDGGQSWKQIYPHGANHVAVDWNQPLRLAVGAGDHVAYSMNGGKDWQVLDNLPNPFGPVVGFAGNRLLAGTKGNGVFWYPLQPEAVHPVQAKKIPEAPTFNINEKMPVPGKQWYLWIGRGEAETSTDTQIYASTPSSQLIRAKKPDTHASISLPLEQLSSPFILHAKIKQQGQGFSHLAIQVFDNQKKQIAWIHLGELRNDQDWSSISKRVDLPKGAHQVNIALVIDGNLSAWIDDISFSPVGSFFP